MNNTRIAILAGQDQVLSEPMHKAKQIKRMKLTKQEIKWIYE